MNNRKKKRKRKRVTKTNQSKHSPIVGGTKQNKNKKEVEEKNNDNYRTIIDSHKSDCSVHAPNIQTIDHGVHVTDLMSQKRKVYNWIVKNWGISAVIAAVPSVFSLLASLKNISEQGKCVMIVLTIVISILLAIRSYADSRDKIKRDNGEKYYEKVIGFDGATKDNITQGILSKITHVSDFLSYHIQIRFLQMTLTIIEA